MYVAPSGNTRLKHVIEKDMFNHHKNVIYAQPTMQYTEPAHHVNHYYPNLCCPPDIVHSEDFAMVRSTFKALINNNKGLIDTSPPESFELIDRLNRNRKPNEHEDMEHARNLISLEQRMNRIKENPVEI